jgi:hypothetical protein
MVQGKPSEPSKALQVFEAFRRVALTFPGVDEATSYGTPAFKLRGRLLARLHQDGRSLVMRIGLDERDMLTSQDPEVFFITDHYRDYPMILVNLEKASLETLRRLFAQAWRDLAPKGLRAMMEDRQ